MSKKLSYFDRMFIASLSVCCLFENAFQDRLRETTVLANDRSSDALNVGRSRFQLRHFILRTGN